MPVRWVMSVLRSSLKNIARNEVKVLNRQPKEASSFHNEEEQIAKTLFIVACSAGKSAQHEADTKWVDCIRQEKHSRFQEFASLRGELLEFYSAIKSEKVAEDVYVGFKYQNPLRWKKAWKVNAGLPSSGVSRAIFRYTGKLYCEFEQEVLHGLANGTLNNVLIISALHGPTLPSDYLPFYDLTMGDIWSDKTKLKDKWPCWVREQAGNNLKTFLNTFEEIYIMVGNEYKPTAMAIKEIMPIVRRCRVAQPCGSQSNREWGRELNGYLLTLIKLKRNFWDASIKKALRETEFHE